MNVAQSFPCFFAQTHTHTHTHTHKLIHINSQQLLSQVLSARACFSPLSHACVFIGRCAIITCRVITIITVVLQLRKHKHTLFMWCQHTQVPKYIYIFPHCVVRVCRLCSVWMASVSESSSTVEPYNREEKKEPPQTLCKACWIDLYLWTGTKWEKKMSWITSTPTKQTKKKKKSFPKVEF